MADNGKLATVFGGSGFVGRYIVWSLAKRGYRVRAAVRRPDLAGHLQPMGVVGQIHAVQANLRFADSVVRAVEGADVVINAVGILAPTGAQTFEAVHAEGARRVAKAAREAGATRLVHISAIGADKSSNAQYARTKAEGEDAVLAEFPSAIILRPSIVFGAEDQFFNRFAALARISPALPLIGGGRTKFQPVFVGDLGQAAANAAIDTGNTGSDLRTRRPAGDQLPRCARIDASLHRPPSALAADAVLDGKAAGTRNLAAPQYIAADHRRSGSPSEIRQRRLRRGQARRPDA